MKVSSKKVKDLVPSTHFFLITEGIPQPVFFVKDEHSWFINFLSYEEGEIVVTRKLEKIDPHEHLLVSFSSPVEIYFYLKVISNLSNILEECNFKETACRPTTTKRGATSLKDRLRL